MKQKSIRVIEVNSLDELKKISQKLPLFKGHYFLLKEKNEEIEKFLKSLNLNYFIVNEEVVVKKIKIEKVDSSYEGKKKDKDIKNVEIYDRIIRSGEEIVSDKHLIFTKRINGGAKIVCESSIEIFDENEGYVICNGEYMIVKRNNGVIIFNGEEIGEVKKLTLFKDNETKVLE